MENDSKGDQALDPGFYDKVRPHLDVIAEEARMAGLPFEKMLQQMANELLGQIKDRTAVQAIIDQYRSEHEEEAAAEEDTGMTIIRGGDGEISITREKGGESTVETRAVAAVQSGSGTTITGKLVRIEEPHPGVAVVWMCRAWKRNALSDDLKRALLATARSLAVRPDIRAVVLASEGPYFSAGNDLTGESPFGEGLEVVEARQVLRLGAAFTDAYADLPQPTIAAVQGGAIAGGIALALACDFRILAPDAWLHAPEVALGLPLGWNTLPRLVALVGPARAKLVASLCRRIDAPQALEWGLCEEIAENPVKAAVKMGAEIAGLPSLALQMNRGAIDRYAILRRDVEPEVDQMLLARDDPEGLAARRKVIAKLTKKPPR